MELLFEDQLFRCSYTLEYICRLLQNMTTFKVKWFISSKFGWSSASKIKFNPSGSLLFVSGVCRVIRMGAVEVGEMVVYQVRIIHTL